jgi:hypothetical protein
MSPSFDPALIINPKFPALVLTGESRLYGDIITGLQGIKKGTISGRPFIGERLVDGNIIKTDQDERPKKNQIYLDILFENWKSYLSRKDLVDISELTSDTTTRLDFSQMDRSEVKAVYITNEIFNQKDWRISGPVTLVSAQPLFVKNNITLENYVTLVCNKNLILEGNIHLKRTIIYSSGQISVNKVNRFEGQLFSENSIVIGQNISLDYPSVLLVNSELDTASIILSSHSEVSGSVILSSKFDSTKTFQNQSKIIIDRDAKVNGLVYSDNLTTLNGQVNGMVITDRFYLYHSPTVYYNWIKDGVIDRNALSDKFRLPLFFKTSDTKLSPLFFE